MLKYTIGMTNPVDTESLVLQLLLAGENYGGGLMVLLRDVTKRRMCLTQGSVYPLLREMEGEGLLESREGDPIPERGGRPRRYYKLTEAGVKLAKRERAAIVAVFGVAEDGAPPADIGGSLDKAQAMLDSMAENRRKAAGSNDVQPAPIPNDRRPVWDLVIADMKDRDHVGRERYGTPLQAFNGRDPLVDAYQEALDLAVYLRQAIAERDSMRPSPGAP